VVRSLPSGYPVRVLVGIVVVFVVVMFAGQGAAIEELLRSSARSPEGAETAISAYWKLCRDERIMAVLGCTRVLSTSANRGRFYSRASSIRTLR
jgi:hypothetical protein